MLSNLSPLSELADMFDSNVLLQVDRDELEARLILRWLEQDLSPKDAQACALENDMTISDFVGEGSFGAQFTFLTYWDIGPIAETF